MDLEALKQVLEPFSYATDQLEAEKWPVIHLAGRYLLFLVFGEESLLQADARDEDSLVHKFSKAAKAKLIEFLDDPGYLQELAVS